MSGQARSSAANNERGHRSPHARSRSFSSDRKSGSKSSLTEKKQRADTPDPRTASSDCSHRRASTADSRSSAGSGKRVSFDSIPETSSSGSEEDSYIAASQPRHILKPPKYNGNTSFETFFAQFQNCVLHNKWSRTEQLAYLKAALVDDAGQVLWDYGAEITNSLSSLVKLLKERFGGTMRADKYRLELRGRKRKPSESLEVLHRDIRRLIVLAHPDLDSRAREVMACDYFVQSIAEPDLVLKIREANPSTLDEALHVALRQELWLKEAAGYRMDERPHARARPSTEMNSSQDAAAYNHLAAGFKKLEAKFSELQQQIKPSAAAATQQSLDSQKSPAAALERPAAAASGQDSSAWSKKPPSSSAAKGNTAPAFDAPPQRPWQRGGRRTITCWSCGGEGHISRECPQQAKAPNKFGPAAHTVRNNGIREACEPGRKAATWTFRRPDVRQSASADYRADRAGNTARSITVGRAAEKPTRPST